MFLFLIWEGGGGGPIEGEKTNKTKDKKGTELETLNFSISFYGKL